MKHIICLLLTNLFMAISLFSQQIPLVYNTENRGANYPKPAMPALEQLPVIEPLTDPFEWSDGKGRSIDYKNWSRRRNEIAAEIQHYETGEKPLRPDSITAT